MKNYRETGKLLLNLFENVEAKLRLLAGLELVCAVAGADCDSERVNARSRNEIKYLLGLSGETS